MNREEMLSVLQAAKAPSDVCSLFSSSGHDVLTCYTLLAHVLDAGTAERKAELLKVTLVLLGGVVGDLVMAATPAPAAPPAAPSGGVQ